MKRILPLLLALLMMLAAVPALAANESLDLVISLMVSQLPDEDENSKVEIYHEPASDTVILKWKMKTIDSDTYLPVASLLYEKSSALFDSVCETTSSMKSILETMDCEQSVLGLILTSDEIPIAVICNGTIITAVQ